MMSWRGAKWSKMKKRRQLKPKNFAELRGNKSEKRGRNKRRNNKRRGDRTKRVRETSKGVVSLSGGGASVRIRV